ASSIPTPADRNRTTGSSALPGVARNKSPVPSIQGACCCKPRQPNPPAPPQTNAKTIPPQPPILPKISSDSARPSAALNAQVSSLHHPFQPIVRKFDPGGHLRLIDVVIVIVGQVREQRARRADAPRRPQRLVQTHVRRVRIASQRVEYCHFHSAHLGQNLERDLFAIAQVGQPFPRVLRKQVSIHAHRTVRQRQRRDL